MLMEALSRFLEAVDRVRGYALSRGLRERSWPARPPCPRAPSGPVLPGHRSRPELRPGLEREGKDAAPVRGKTLLDDESARPVRQP